MCTPHRAGSRTRSLAALVLLSTPLAASPLRAQGAAHPTLTEGSRVRVTTTGPRRLFRAPVREGVLVRVGTDSLTLVTARRHTSAVAAADVSRLEVLVRTGDQRRNMIVGGAGGVVVGGVLGVALSEGMSGCGGIPGCTHRAETTKSMLAGAAIGGAIGLFGGAALPVHQWREVLLSDGRRVGVAIPLPAR